MPYTADISRANPACLLFLLDQSGSMTEALAGQPGQTKQGQSEQAISGILNAVALRCSQGMEVRDYFHIGIIGYDNEGLQTIFPGTSIGNPFLPVSQVAETARVEQRQVREPDGAGGLATVTRNVPMWDFYFWSKNPHPGNGPTIDLLYDRLGGTPTCKTLDAAFDVLQRWIPQYPASYPPMVIHVTDGESSDGNPERDAARVRELATNDGNVLLFNVHLSDVAAMPIQYPDSENSLPDRFARSLFRMSSVLPDSIRGLAATLDLPVRENSRGFVFNADMTALVQFLDIGTRGPSNLH